MLAHAQNALDHPVTDYAGFYVVGLIHLIGVNGLLETALVTIQIAFLLWKWRRDARKK
jgi:hypothetical protein